MATREELQSRLDQARHDLACADMIDDFRRREVEMRRARERIETLEGKLAELALARPTMPRLSGPARNRLLERIETERAVGSRQVASDIEFLLDFHDRVHGEG